MTPGEVYADRYIETHLAQRGEAEKASLRLHLAIAYTVGNRDGFKEGMQQATEIVCREFEKFAPKRETEGQPR